MRSVTREALGFARPRSNDGEREVGRLPTVRFPRLFRASVATLTALIGATTNLTAFAQTAVAERDPPDPSHAPPASAPVSPPPTPIPPSPDRTRVLVRVVGKLDEALYERTAGQVSDLPAQLVLSREEEQMASSLAERLDEARILGQVFRADVVVWFEHPSEMETVVFVALPAHRRVLVRRVGNTGPNDPTSRSTSAMLEASALVVRTALVALDYGESIGISNDELTAIEPGSGPKSTRPAVPHGAKAVGRPGASPSSAVPAPISTRRWFIDTGWQLQADGQSPNGSRAIIAAAGVARGPWFGFTRVSLGLPSRFHDDLASLEIWRHGVGAFVGRRVLHHAHWDLEAAAGASFFVFYRSAFARDSRFSPTEASDRWSPAVDGEVRVFYRPAVPAFLSLGGVLGVDTLVGPPVFSYSSELRETRRPMWYAQPRLSFVVSWH